MMAFTQSTVGAGRTQYVKHEIKGGPKVLGSSSVTILLGPRGSDETDHTM